MIVPAVETLEKSFIDRDQLYAMAERPVPSMKELSDILSDADKIKGLSLQQVSALLAVEDPGHLSMIFAAAEKIKNLIYGRRIVLFVPLYIGNRCSNNCLYCGYRKDNRELERSILDTEAVQSEVLSLLKKGHKRLLMLCGESAENPVDYFIDCIHAAYSVRDGKNFIRRINVEIAPMEVADFAKLMKAKIGTYACFQETYDPVLYKKYHPSGPKSDYHYRLNVMDRAMTGGIDDVGIGVLFGLSDYRFEVLALMEHARHLEEKFGCGPHTVSVPRLMPAEGSALSMQPPFPVSDTDFKKLVSVIRLAMPYTGIILSTRENETVRREILHYGVSQISAGSRTNPGAYARSARSDSHEESGTQFSLGDHRSLDEVISGLIDESYIPSFCTGCYRKGRVGQDFMDLAKPGLIKEYCMPNGVFTFMEYLMDYAKPETREKGLGLVDKLVGEVGLKSLKDKMEMNIASIRNGERDIYF